MSEQDGREAREGESAAIKHERVRGGETSRMLEYTQAGATAQQVGKRLEGGPRELEGKMSATHEISTHTDQQISAHDDSRESDCQWKTFRNSHHDDGHLKERRTER